MLPAQPWQADSQGCDLGYWNPPHASVSSGNVLRTAPLHSPTSVQKWSPSGSSENSPAWGRSHSKSRSRCGHYSTVLKVRRLGKPALNASLSHSY